MHRDIAIVARRNRTRSAPVPAPAGLLAAAAAACLIATSVRAGDAGSATVDESAHTEAAVIAVDQHWLDAELDGDTAYLERLLLPEYRSVGADGVAHAKAAIVAHAAQNRGSDAARRRVEAWLAAHPSGTSVAIHGDVAVLSFYDPRLGPQQGVRSSDIFVYGGDRRWHALYSQHSTVGQG